MSRAGTILLVDDEEGIRKQLLWALRDEYQVLEAGDREEALRQLREHTVDLVLLDLRFPPRTEEITGGKEILEAIQGLRPTTPVIIMTGDQDRETAVEMVARGAFDLFRKPIDLPKLRVILKRGLRMRRLEREVSTLRSQIDTGARAARTSCILVTFFMSLVLVPKVIIRCRAMSKPWPWAEHEKYLDRKLVDIRREFNIKPIIVA